jgi:YaiO family outer membrane protein
MLRAQVLGASGRYQEAVNELEDLLDRQPDHQEAQLLASQFRMFSQEHALALEHTYSRFSNTFSPWLQTSLSYRRNLSKGVVMGRLTHARMFDRQALQAEIDTYPTFGPKTYAFLNLGASGGGIFPGFRWGAELYRVLPQNWEVSAGMKGLYFEQNPVHVYTAQLGRYYQQYWFSVRGFAAQVGSSTDLTGLLSMRRYLQNEDHFLSLYLGNGSTPLRINTLAEIRRLSAAWAGIDYQHPLKNREWLLRGSLEYQQESYEEIRRTDRISLGIHVQRRF